MSRRKALESAAMPLDYRLRRPPRPLTRGERALRGVALTLLIGGLTFGLVDTVVLALAVPAFWPFSRFRFIGGWGPLGGMPPVIPGAAGGYLFAPIGIGLDPRLG